MSCDACKSGFNWNGTPTGSETTIADSKTYVTGTSKSAAILIVHDVFGWTFSNLRLLADHFAKEANATVYLADFFGGEVVSPEVFSDPELREKFDLKAFMGRNSKDIRYPEIKAVAQALKSQYPKVGAIGYCYGGWAIFRLGNDTSLVDAVSTAHPSRAEHSEIEGLKVPTQILAPETDQAFTPELKQFCNQTIPSLGLPYEYVYFPGVAHGFAARGDESNKVQKDALERAKRSAVNFFTEYLH